MSYRIVIEIYVLLSVMNVFLGIGTSLYQEKDPTGYLRSPFTGYPLIGIIPTPLNAQQQTGNLTASINTTSGFKIPFISQATDAFQSFASIWNGIIRFSNFFDLGYTINLLNSTGFPSGFLYIVTVPVAIYTFYMVFVMITNRLGY